MLELFERIFESADYPMSWVSGIIVPIFKGGEINEVTNYRGIILINIKEKI